MKAHSELHEFFSRCYEERARCRQEGDLTPVFAALPSKLFYQRIKDTRQWEGREHDGRFWGVYWVSELGVELCEVDGGVCYEAYRSEQQASTWMELTAPKGNTVPWLVVKGHYEVRPIPAGTRVWDQQGGREVLTQEHAQ